jgi:hypothetical protein
MAYQVWRTGDGIEIGTGTGIGAENDYVTMPP